MATTWDLCAATISNDMTMTMKRASNNGNHLASLRCRHFRQHDNDDDSLSTPGIFALPPSNDLTTPTTNYSVTAKTDELILGHKIITSNRAIATSAKNMMKNS